MTASDIFKTAALDILTELGESATYTPETGDAVVIQVLISSQFNAQPSGMGSETWAQRITAEFRLSDLPAGSPLPGETLTLGAVVYTLAAPIENNGNVLKWVVT
jgi:hypothetical protein